MNQPRTEFGGFVPPTSNFFRMPNEWTNLTAEINNLAELKVVEYVLRHTWGFQEYGIAKTISIDEFMHGRRRADGSRMDKGTKLSEQSVRNGIAKAIEDGFLTCEVDDSDKARIKKAYALKMQSGEVQDLDPLKSRGQNVRPQSTKSLTSDPQTLDPSVLDVRPRSEKETQERYSRKTPKKERSITHSTTSLSFASQEEMKRYEWIKQEKVTCPKDRAKVQGYVQELAPITSKEQMHRLKEFALSQIQGPNKRVFLGNLAGSLDAFLQAERAMQPFLPTAEPTTVAAASQSDIETLAAEILHAYPELVLRTGEDQWGPYVEVVYGDGDNSSYCLRDAEDWSRLRNSQKRLARAMTYGTCCVREAQL